MEKTLRILGLMAVVGAAGIVVAQQAVTRQGVLRVKSAAQPASTVPLATMGRSMLSSNGVTEVLVGYFCAKQQLEIDRAKRDGHPERVDAVIRANCSALLTAMTPEQQKGEIAVWGPPPSSVDQTGWAAVARTPSMVDHLLRIDAATDAKATKSLEAARNSIYAPFRALDAKIVATAEYKAAPTKEEKVAVFRRLYDAQRPRFDPVERGVEITRFHAKSVEETRLLLTPPQRAEFDAIKARFESTIRAAAEGAKP